MASLEAMRQHRQRHFLLNIFAFSFCYLLANTLAQQQGVNRHIAFAFETHIPFLPWMIIPYLSSGVFFFAAFWTVGSLDQLRMLSQRLLLATVLASLVFVLYPLQFSWPKPAVSSALFAALFGFLSLVDQPYNQLPSLHVAFCLIFWQSLRGAIAPGYARAMLAVWLMLTAVATLFTYQHHVLDVLAGGLLGLACVCCIRPERSDPDVAFYYLMAAAIVLMAGVLVQHSSIAWYGGSSLFMVSLAYYRRDRHFLHKTQGRHRWWVWLVYAPYLIGYRLTWHAVAWRERHRPVIVQLTKNLWVGRRLNDAEARRLPKDCSVIDLAGELDETAVLRSPRYRHFPLLDLIAPPPDAVCEIVAAIIAETEAGRPVYLHCAMGYSRCILLANTYLACTRR